MKTVSILVTGGGSSGHISPALAVISALNELAAQPNADWTPRYLYLGGKRGLEKNLVEAAGIPFYGVETGKLRRYFSRENFSDALRVPVGVAQALKQVRAFKPDVVLATGGYVAVPPVVAAWMLRVPVIIHEQTVQIGLANRISARFATRIALSSDSSLQDLTMKLKAKAFVAGNPVRPIVFGGDREEGRKWAGFASDDDDLPTIYVTGGSQGARIINRAIEDVLPPLLENCRVVHQCGVQPQGEEQDFDRLQRAGAALPPLLHRRYHLARFIGDEIRDVYALADLVVGRAGAGTINEVCALGLPAIYIPLVPTRGDEQTRNARVCETEGAATTLAQSDLNGQTLLNELKMLGDTNLLKKMGQAARTLARPDAARDMAQAVLALASRPV